MFDDLPGLDHFTDLRSFVDLAIIHDDDRLRSREWLHLVSRSMMNRVNDSVLKDPSMIMHSIIPSRVIVGSIEYL